VLYRGIWPTYFAAPLGVAAVASRLFNLDEKRAAQALAMALIMLTPGTGHHAAITTARWLAVGHAAARGLHAALAAQAGFTSDLKLADGEFLKNVYGLTPNLAILGNGFGKAALHQVSFKPWCAARQTMAATQALREIVDGGVAPEAITAIEVAVLPPHQKMIDHGVTAGDRFSHLTSVQYQMAVAALAPDTAYELGGPPGGIALALQAFMSRIMVRPDASLQAAGYPRQWAAEIAITTATGRHERKVNQVPGDPGSSYDETELRLKFRKLVMPVPASQADAMFARALTVLDQPASLLREIESIDAG
jgi:2-methylcitrate dehydratase PrpD